MLCLSDNDIILKLAACNLLDDAVAALDIPHEEVYVLPTAQFSLPSQARRMSPTVHGRVMAFLAAVSVIDWPSPQQELRLFEDTLGIDAGEAVLYSSTADLDDDYVVITGDKVSLRALAASTDCAAIVTRLAGKVLCFEQVIQLCIQHHGFVRVRAGVVPGRSCDEAIRSIFGSGMAATEAGVTDGLENYIRHLRSQTGPLLLT